jgi:PAS domain-containing protein
MDEARLAALVDSELLDTPAEEIFDRFTRLAVRWLGAPVALISLIDDHRQFFKSAVGLPEPWASQRETPLSHSICQYGLTTSEPLIVCDAREHPWLEQSLAISELGAIAYAGIPLVTAETQILGMFCVIDSVPRTWSEDELTTLRELAAMVGTELELRTRVRALKLARQSHDADRVLLRSVLDCMEDSVVVTATDGNVILTNHAAQRSRPADVLRTAENSASFGVFLPDGVTPLNPDNAPSKRALLGFSVRDVELIRRLPGEPEQIISVNSSPIRDASGVVRAAVSVGRDVTSVGAQRSAAADRGSKSAQRRRAALRYGAPLSDGGW